MLEFKVGDIISWDTDLTATRYKIIEVGKQISNGNLLTLEDITTYKGWIYKNHPTKIPEIYFQKTAKKRVFK